MNARFFAHWPQALVLAGMVSSLGAVSAWGAAGDNGQYFMIEGLYLAKDDGDTLPFTRANGAGPFGLVTSDDVDPDGSAGARVTAQFKAYGHTWQASAFVATGFDEDVLVSNLDPVTGGNTSTTYVSGFAPENSEEFDTIDLNEEAELWGAEFSWVKSLESYGFRNVELLVGLRYLHYGENIRSSVFDEQGDFPFGNERDDATIKVDNDLAGLQIGLQGMWSVTERISIGGSLKGGIAANFIDRKRSFIDRDGDIGNLVYANGQDETRFAEFAEFNPRIDFSLGESATLTIGGSVLWINETSRAASHYATLANPADSMVRAHDDELFYGGSIGLKLALN